MMNKILLKQKLLEKSIIELKLLTSHRLNDVYLVRKLIRDLIIVEDEIKELQKHD